MAETSKVLEGVFAISKPRDLSSAQVIRDLQQHFQKSKTLAPLLEQTKQNLEQNDRHRTKRRRRDNDSAFKMGHGGTLDPLATGVLIVGLGRGTKHLQNFLACTKQYDTVVLFGKSTDTYDIAGKIVAEASFKHVTRDKVEFKLPSFKGDVKQAPPIYSALKFNGIPAYEYARSGKPLPREIELRDMKVDECSLVYFYETGQHDFRWPSIEAEESEKSIAKRLMQVAEDTQGHSAIPAEETDASVPAVATSAASDTAARVDNLPSEAPDDVPAASPNTSMEKPEQQTSTNESEQESNVEQPGAATTSTALESETNAGGAKDEIKASAELDSVTNTAIDAPTAPRSPSRSELKAQSNRLSHASKAALHTHEITTLSSTPAPAPAARITLTVSSGFYVRSFAHDLGLSLNTYGIMSELTRSRQGDFIIPALADKFPDLIPAITYEDIEAGEETWGPKLQAVLEKWMLDNPLPGGTDAEGNIRPDDRDRRGDKYRRWGGGGGRGGKKSKWRGGNKRNRDD